jgi:hypothetical protein
MAWRGDQLIESGRWTAADRSAFGMRILEDPDFAREMEAGFNLALAVVEPAMMIGDTGLAAGERCRALIAVQDAFDRITVAVERQWAIIDGLFAAEAGRLGVTLD